MGEAQVVVFVFAVVRVLDFVVEVRVLVFVTVVV